MTQPGNNPIQDKETQSRSQNQQNANKDSQNSDQNDPNRPTSNQGSGKSSTQGGSFTNESDRPRQSSQQGGR